jgi:uncharacterized membrane protein
LPPRFPEPSTTVAKPAQDRLGSGDGESRTAAGASGALVVADGEGSALEAVVAVVTGAGLPVGTARAARVVAVAAGIGATALPGSVTTALRGLSGPDQRNCPARTV